MSTLPLKTAVLGLTTPGAALLEIAGQTGLFDIQVLADKDIEVAQRLAREFKAQAVNDFRLALTQKDLDCVIFASSLHNCVEHIRAAISRNLHVFRIAPGARSFEELCMLAQIAQTNNVVFAIGSTWRRRKSFNALKAYLAENGNDSAFLITAQCGVGPYHDLAQRDPKLAGGGMLLYSCYGMIDQILQFFGEPSQLYSWHSSQAPDRQQRLYVTEDTVVLSLKFSDTLLGNIVASKTFAADADFLKIHIKDKILLATGQKFSVLDLQGNVVEETLFDDTETQAMMDILTNFAQSIASPEEHNIISCASDNLTTMAVVDAAYLSARTAMPETPQKIMQLWQSTASRILNNVSKRTL